MTRRTFVLTLAAGSLLPLHAATAQVIRNGQLIYPQGEPISRATTKVEAEWSRRYGQQAGGGADAVTPPPTGPIHCAAEFEPQEGIIIGWEGGASLNAIQADMAKRITVDAASRVYVVCETAGIQSTATTTLTNAGCNMSRVSFLIRALDSIWMCDYGPRFIYEGNCRAVVDHWYNRPRATDNVFPDHWAQTYKKQAFYQLGSAGFQLVHGGGNFHLDGGNNRGFATKLIVNENTTPWTTNNSPFTGHSFSEATIGTIWSQYQGLNMTLLDPFPTSVDATQHIDMWMQMVDNNKVIISDWPNNSGSTQDNICDNTATLLASQGYTVFRVPAFSIGGTHYTFTNTVFCNNVLLVPTYTHATVSPHNATALAVFQSALPVGKTAIGVPCQNIIGLAGAIHCIVRLYPAHKGAAGPNGGLAPTAYLKSPNGGQTLTGGQAFSINWISDDDAGVTTVDLHLSTDGGSTYPTVIATGLAPVGSFNWTVPNLNTAQARVRITANDAVSNTGSDASDANFTIGNPPPACYANCDASSGAPLLTANDFACFLNAYAQGASYADCDGVGGLTANDFQCFLNAYANGCS
jgi:agmatine/peptidylarginine deiminase